MLEAGVVGRAYANVMDFDKPICVLSCGRFVAGIDSTRL